MRWSWAGLAQSRHGSGVEALGVRECSVPRCGQQTRAGFSVTRRILVTGASGFVARALFSGTRTSGEYVAASRRAVDLEGIEWRHGPTLSGTADWKGALEGVEVVVHLAGRVHLAAGGDTSPYFAENCDGTLKLARDADAAGVQRFVFLSSAKVLGDESGAAPLK